MEHLRCLFENSSRYRLRQELEYFAKHIPGGLAVLDAGSGEAPYKELFQHTRYHSTDFLKVNKNYSSPTYICDLKAIPVQANYYDFIVFTQVMEHLPEPKQVLNELYRVLKPGGKMFYSAPFHFEEHEQPYDFYRYTKFGVNYLLKSAGFTIDRIDWLEGYFGTTAYQLRTMARYLPFKPKDLSLGFIGYFIAPFMFVLKISFMMLSLIFNKLEIKNKYQGAGFPKNYVAIAIKPKQ